MNRFKRPDEDEEGRPEKGEPKPGKRAAGGAVEGGSERRAGERKLRAALERAEKKPGGKRKADSKPKAKAKPATKRDAKAGSHEARKRGTKRNATKRRRRARDGRRKARAAIARSFAAIRAGIAALLTVAAALAAVLFAVFGRVLAMLLRTWLRIRPPTRQLANRCRKAVNRAAVAVTPKRVLALVVAGAAVLLVLSQYADYRSVSIGAEAYSGLETIAPPPEVERAEAGAAHAYVFVPIGVLCLALLWVALRGRPGAANLIGLAGLAAVLVALLVDRPAGLDVSTAAMSFDGVRAQLLGGFYAQIAAGLVLVVSSRLLARSLNAEPVSHAKRPDRSGRRAERSERRVRGAEA